MRNVLRVAAFAASCTGLASQCEVGITPGLAIPGFNGDVRDATSWDPDGVGPLPSVVVMAGLFGEANGVWCNEVAFWDGASWQPLSDGLGVGHVRAVASGPDRQMYAGGTFMASGQVAIERLAQWDGAGWVELGGGVNDAINDILVLASGNVVACGEFTEAGGSPHNRIAEWDGVSWHAFASGLPLTANSLAELANGDLIVAGDFITVGDQPANHLAQWTGGSWQPVGTGTNGPIHATAVLPNGDLIVGGQFTTAGGLPANNVARWDGLSWSSIGGGVSGTVHSIASLQAGDFVVTTESASSQGAVHTWSGGAWQQPALADGPVYASVQDGNGDLFVGGGFHLVDAVACNGVGIWNGTSWLATGGGLDGEVIAITTLPTGGFVAGGSFAYRGGVYAPYLAQYDGGTWTSLGVPDGPVHALARLGNGDLIVGGEFDHIDSTAFARIARWDGTAWHALGSGLDNSVACLAVSPSGDLVVGGYFDVAGGVAAHGVATWDGAAWHAYGPSPGNTIASTVAMQFLPGGELIVAGTFLSGPFFNPIHGLMRWDGAMWHPMLLASVGSVNAMTVLPGGDLAVAGSVQVPGTSNATSLMRWDGNSWHAIGGGAPGVLQDLLVLPDGDLLIAGVVPNGIMRWDGSMWRNPPCFGTDINSMNLAADGSLILGGEFTRIFKQSTFLAEPTSGIAIITSDCPATVSSQGTACPGSSSTLGFSADTLPWIGSALETTGTGVPATAIVVAATGFTTTVQTLSSFLPQALPGCELRLVPSILDAQLATSTVVQQQTALPDDVALIGQQFHQQLVAWDLGAQLQVNEVISSNALTMTIGAL